MRRLIRFLSLPLVLACMAPAGATGAIESLITDADRLREAAFDQAKATALAEARAGGSPADVKVLDELMARPHLAFEGLDLTGDWQCRTVKAGGFATLVVYGWFRCRVSDDGAGWMLEKLTGSQRTTGFFYDENPTTLTYLGRYHVAGDPAPQYGAGPASDQIGRAFRTGRQTWQIEFPLPTYESKLDILEFRR